MCVAESECVIKIIMKNARFYWAVGLAYVDVDTHPAVCIDWSVATVCVLGVSWGYGGCKL